MTGHGDRRIVHSTARRLSPFGERAEHIDSPPNLAPSRGGAFLCPGACKCVTALTDAGTVRRDTERLLDMDKMDMEILNVGLRQRKAVKNQETFLTVYGGLVLLTICLVLTMWV